MEHKTTYILYDLNFSEETPKSVDRCNVGKDDQSVEKHFPTSLTKCLGGSQTANTVHLYCNTVLQCNILILASFVT